MNTKPISPALHGIIDYAFSGMALLAPAALQLNANTIKTYAILGGSFLLTNAITKTPAGIKPILTFKEHQKVDTVMLAGLPMLALFKFIRKNKSSLLFHAGFVALAAAHYVLTDYDAVQ